MMDKTIEYYNKNANVFSLGTGKLDFSKMQNHFLEFLSKGDYILDFGCGSGRDAKYFLTHGMNVDLVDGSWKMCEIAAKTTGLPPQCVLFQNFCSKKFYDGIWACASLLHLYPDELIKVLKNLSNCLKENGICYISFKYGEFEGNRNNRYFLDMTERKMLHFLENFGELFVLEMLSSNDARKEKNDELWLNVFLRKEKKDGCKEMDEV